MTLFPKKGEAVIHGAMVRHGSDPAQKGVRVILALFFDEDHCNHAAEFQLSLIVGFVSVLAAVALGYFLLFMDFEAMEAQAMEARARLARSDETAAGNRLEDVNEHPLPGMYNAPPSRFSDAVTRNWKN